MDWRDEIPEELRSTTLVQEAKDIGSIVKQAVDFQRMLGGSIRVPSEHASDDERQAFLEKVGRHGLVPRDKFTEFVRPAEPSAYSLPSPPSDAEQIGLSQGLVDQWKAQAHELGLSPEQFNKFAEKQIEQVRAAAQARADRFGKVDSDLKGDWGEEAYEARKNLALQAAQKFGGEDLVAYLADNPDAVVIKALAEAGKLFAERGTGDLQPRPSFAETREEASIKLSEIANNPNHPFNMGHMRAGPKAFEAATKEVMRLRAISMGLKPGADDFMFERTG
jgi:hypothetical protein